MSVDDSNVNTALAGALVDELARAGCRRAVISPGSRSTPITLALARHPEIETTVVLDERVAGFLALGIALATGIPAPVSCTSGSAGANLHPAVVEADQAEVPMVILTSDRPPELRGIGAGQTIDQVKLYGSAVRWFCEVGTHAADDAGLLHYRATGTRAVAEAIGSRGPVHLNLAWRDPLGPEPVEGAVSATDRLALAGRADGTPLTRLSVPQELAAATLDELAERLRGASRPLIVAGRQRQQELSGPLTRLGDLGGAPIFAEPTSGLRHGPHWEVVPIAAYELVCRRLPEGLRPDLVLRFGEMPTSKALRAVLYDEEIEQVAVVGTSGSWNEPTRVAGELVRAEPVAVAKQLSSRLGERSTDRQFLDRWLAAEGAAQAVIERELHDSWSEPAIHRHLYGHLPAAATLLLASSMPIRDAESFSPATERSLDVISNRGANGIDGLISTATGAALGTGGPVVATLGDLATVHDLGGLVNLGAAGVDLRLVVINNGGGRIFEFLPQHDQLPAAEFERLFTTPSGVDFERAASLAGIGYQRISELEGLAALGGEGPKLVEAVVDPGPNLGLHHTIAAAVADAASGAIG
ncbi:MAG: 2-succinyl-5-enolpyruvyl-6-hydroxy-3-cyclohexene-1-carboxylic-acid synthase [Solirubrobacterales bacterium]